jgi:hypothetical protein
MRAVEKIHWYTTGIQKIRAAREKDVILHKELAIELSGFEKRYDELCSRIYEIDPGYAKYHSELRAALLEASLILNHILKMNDERTDQ